MAKKTTTPEGFIDLGQEYGNPVCCETKDSSESKSEKHIAYPSLWLRDIKALPKLDGEVYFLAKGRVVSWSKTERGREGDETAHSEIELEVTAMKLVDESGKEVKTRVKVRDAGDDLDSALTSIKSAETEVDDDEE